MKKIYTDKDILAIPSEEIDITHPEDMKFARIVLLELECTLKASYNGVGLAAPQIGHFIRLFLFRTNNGIIKHILNPSSIEVCENSRSISIEEGCLSCPGVKTDKIQRNRRIKVHGYNIKGKEVTYWLTDLESVIFQHELDHLNGVLITDYI